MRYSAKTLRALFPEPRKRIFREGGVMVNSGWVDLAAVKGV
jgi:hypothetical protein